MNMKREIKFRAWHIELEDMTFSNGSSSDFWYKVDKYPPMYHVMQYTGLKDNNYKEIYEGDIIKDKDGLRYTVEYRGTEFCKVNLTSTNLFDSNTYLKIEVIGNIYETPHLLNNEQEAQVSDTTKV